MPIKLPGPTERATPSAQNRSALSYRGNLVPDTYSRQDMRISTADANTGAILQEGFQRVSKNLEEARIKTATLETAAAKSFFLRENLRIQNELEQDPDYENYESKYETASGQVFQQALGMVNDPQARQILQLDLQDSGAKTASNIKSLAWKKSVAARAGVFEDTMAGLQEALLAAPDEDTRKMAFDAAGENIVGALKEGLIDEGGAAKQKRLFRQQYALARAGSMAPEDAVAALAPEQEIAIEGPDADILKKIAWIESRGDPNAKNPRSSATGIFQFTKETAKQYGIDPNDPTQSIEAAQKLLDDNRNSLTKALGRKPTGAELYIAHQQGANAAANLLKNPDVNAADLLADVYGDRKKAEAAVKNNGGNLGMSAKEFTDMWKQHFEDAETVDTIQVSGETEDWVKDIPYEQRVKLYEEQRKQMQSKAKETVYSLIDENPAMALAALNSGAAGRGLESSDIKTLKEAARTALDNAAANAERDRLAAAAIDNDDSWQAYLAGQMTLGKLQQLEGNNRIDPELASFIRQDLVKKAEATTKAQRATISPQEKANVYTELWGKLNDLVIQKEDGSYKSEAPLEDIIRFQRDVAKHVASGALDPGDAETLTKQVAGPFMKKLREGTESGDFRWYPSLPGFLGGNPYTQGFKAVGKWLEDDGRASDTLAKKEILTNFVAALDEWRPEGDDSADFDITQASSKVKKQAIREALREAVIQFKMSEDPALAMAPEPPNGILRGDARRANVLPGKSEAKADSGVAVQVPNEYRFTSETELEAAGLPDGTVVMVNGVIGRYRKE